MLYIFSMYMYVYTFVCNKDVIHTFTSCHNTSSVHYHLFSRSSDNTGPRCLKGNANLLPVYVCLFVYFGNTRTSILRSLCLDGGNQQPLGIVAHGLRHSPRASIKYSAINHVRINRWLKLYKLTG